MRYTPTLKLSTRLVAFVTMIVISAMFILFIGGSLSFKRLSQEFLDRDLQGITSAIDRDLADPDNAYQLQRWVPKMLQVNDVAEMTLSNSVGVIYRFKNTSPDLDRERLYSADFQLEHHTDYNIHFKVQPPYIGHGYSFEALWSVTLAIALALFGLMRGVQWLKEQLVGSELLEERGRMILAGKVEEYKIGDVREWPYTASEALDVLIEELQYARQERSRFDTFIRTQTFLDKLTGTANRVLFDSKLESALHESSGNGGVLLIRIEDWKQVEAENEKAECDEFIIEVGQVLLNLAQRYPDVIFSRYYDADFAVLIPHQSSKDIFNLAGQCIRQLEKLTPPTPLDIDNWVHIGLTLYQKGEKQALIMEELETALKSAQLQKINTWTRFKKQDVKEDYRGSVRWRTLFDTALRPENILLYNQTCNELLKGNRLKFLHHEVLVRIHDPERGEIKAARFISALESVGYEAQMDRSVLVKIVNFLKASENPSCYAINMNTIPFANKEYCKWFRYELLQLSRQKLSQLSFEFSEANIVRHLDHMRPIIRLIAGLGCQVGVDQAGRSIVSTHYIKDLNINYLKLHRSLIKRIDQRHENQLFVRSLVGACSDGQAQVIAVGVDTKKEWQALMDLGIHGGQGRHFSPEVALLPKTKIDTRIKPGKRNRWR
ncbi:RNase E specificity factor CsrD [Vibrio sp. 10N.286.49.B3]|uniref:RNase E specificity factor CsrD n=1 Tax=Vibrio sp. 10N.286.49.B3 TaxID=1880855 RepID=UPI000C849798|nr:RNase E specificity factor CsrD [Vibrio sp. 10N.286.49.B3]PMH39897.1 RNase E specificity factor CsrD [Vibrio sp. 10N.286.49.B3]